MCEALKNIIIPDSVTEIGDCAFMGCISLEKVKIPHSVSVIGEAAFESCESLNNITLPKNVRSISGRAFNGVPNLTINCELKCAPNGWEEDWNVCNCPVNWGVK